MQFVVRKLCFTESSFKVSSRKLCFKELYYFKDGISCDISKDQYRVEYRARATAVAAPNLKKKTA